MRSFALTLLLLVTLATPAVGSDGVLEINQTCAVQTGCFAGDTAGFPVTITSATPARSFRLTSDLGPLSASQTAIDATAVEAAIDLGGFRIFGVGVCAGVPVSSCTPAATGVGVDAGSNSAVTNGIVTGMGVGARLAYSGRLSQMTGFSNSDGFVLGNESVAQGNVATSNGGSGIVCGNHCILRGNTATGNGQIGIRAIDAGILSDNTANQNGATGLLAETGSTVSNNAANQNGGAGIFASAGSNVSGNTAKDNVSDGFTVNAGSTVSGNTAYRNGGNGISGGAGSTVQRNTLRLNVHFGLNFLGNDAAYRENAITANTAGPVNGGVNKGDNYCAGAGTLSADCP